MLRFIILFLDILFVCVYIFLNFKFEKWRQKNEKDKMKEMFFIAILPSMIVLFNFFNSLGNLNLINLSMLFFVFLSFVDYENLKFNGVLNLKKVIDYYPLGVTIFWFLLGFIKALE